MIVHFGKEPAVLHLRGTACRLHMLFRMQRLLCAGGFFLTDCTGNDLEYKEKN